MKNILNKIYLHPIFLTSVLIFILIGKFKFILYFMLTIIIHELGHIVLSIVFKWNIDKIIILPFGALTKFDEIINKPLIEEFLIAIAGITFQLIFFILFKNTINYEYYELINYFIIFFNLMPIYPLDGSKIINVIFNVFFNFKISLLFTAVVSYVFLIVCFLVTFNINKIIVIVLYFLMNEVNRFNNSRKEIFNKFLLERYLRKLKFNKERKVNSVYKMKRDYRHIFFVNNKYMTENYFLKKYFEIK